MQAIYAVKVQGIRAKGRKDRFYVVIPMPLAAAIGIESGEEVHWSLTDRDTLLLKRVNAKPARVAPRTPRARAARTPT